MNRIKKITLAAFSLLLALIMLTGCNADAVWDHLTTPNADTLKNAELFDDCPDITCQMVMEKYLDSPTPRKWRKLSGRKHIFQCLSFHEIGVFEF